MNIGILAHALKSLVQAHEKIETVDKITAIATAATNGATNATWQEKYVVSKAELLNDLRAYLEINLFDYEIEILEMANLRYLLPSEIAAQLIEVATVNETTLAVIGSELKKLADKVKDAIESCETLLTGLSEINIEPYEIEKGEAAVAVQFPISLYKHDLKKLGKEFVKTESILSELIKYSTGEVENFTIEALSNEAATVIIGLTIAAADRFSIILERLSIAFVNIQDGRLKAQELRERKDGSKIILERRKALADTQEELSNDELLEEIKLIASNLNKSSIVNAELGFEKALKKLIEQKINGVEYDVLAIPSETVTGEEDQADLVSRNELIQKINSREGRQIVNLVKDVDLKLLEHLGNPEEQLPDTGS